MLAESEFTKNSSLKGEVNPTKQQSGQGHPFDKRQNVLIVVIYLIVFLFPLVVAIISMFIKPEKIQCGESLNIISGAGDELLAFNIAYLIMSGLAVLFSGAIAINILMKTEILLTSSKAMLFCVENAVFFMS
eukprot:CAMPEP_0202695848 /NCGR_PEP_ID=MMETSP1385-20130828/9316_1 /ASSEMBLY_ACC=CAM_ASM_000861 /TAXON_ID=933848 /ORGANISM="Elphidium margaritaceum" /LENGTH=131 /DNA_ID=CAMNT_0049351927 /DNA_START=170 /DNA_END=561 /DNA_ORIENTATION=-